MKRPGPARATNGDVRIHIRMPAELADWIDRCAEQDGRSRDAWVRRALEAAVGRQKAGEKAD
jgi:metal-responsive CopG/Arc/MetJ family transcriptional regulator